MEVIKNMTTRIPQTVLLAVAITLFIAGASSSLVSAQVPSPCTATLSATGVPAQYSNPNYPSGYCQSGYYYGGSYCNYYYGNPYYRTRK